MPTSRRPRPRLLNVLFVVGLASLGTLTFWWMSYLRTSQERLHTATLERLDAAEELVAEKTRSGSGAEGALADAVRILAMPPDLLEIVVLPLPPGASAFPFKELGGLRAVVVSAAERSRILAKERSQMFMLAGEGSLFLLLVLLANIGLFRTVARERRLAAQTEAFMHAVTHELRSPLAGLRSLLQTLSGTAIPEAERGRFLDMGLVEIERLDALVERVLLSAKLGADGYSPQLGPVDIAEVVRAAVARTQRQAGLDATVPITDGLVLADPHALTLAVGTLVDNAVRYARAKPAVLRVAARPVGQDLEIRFTDAGIGLDAGELSHLFEQFYRAPSGTKVHAKGTGLGLHVARKLVRACGGDLHVESPGRDQGCTFVLRLKRPPTPAAAAPAPP